MTLPDRDRPLSIVPRPGDQRPGGRSARVRRSVHEAVLELIVETGPTVTMDAVAARAGVHKTTLYRRWGTVEILVREALEEYDEHSIQRRPLRDTGSFDGDLREVARIFGTYLDQPITRAVLRMIVAESPKDPHLAGWASNFWLSRARPFELLIDRAVARGELSPDVHAGDVAEPLVGPMVLRALVIGFPLDDEFLERQAALVWRALREPQEVP